MLIQHNGTTRGTIGQSVSTQARVQGHSAAAFDERAAPERFLRKDE